MVPLAACTLLAFIALMANDAVAQTHTGVIQPLRNPLVDETDSPIPRENVDTELWSTNADPHFQVLTPGGDPVTLGDWLGVGGTGEITRTAQGTAVRLDVTGLIPNGTYTAWGFLFDDPPFNFQEIANFPDRVAEGAVGLNDGSDNIIQADANGDAIFEVTLPSGPLSVAGEAPNFVLDGHSSFAIGAVYHNDGMTYGPVPGSMNVGAFTVGFVPEPSSVVLMLVSVVGLAGFKVRRRRRD
jgi:hypothetical protein